MMASDTSNEIFCYFHIDGQFVKSANGKMHYDGGRSNARIIKEGLSLQELTRMISSCVGYDINGADIKYTVKFDANTFLDLVDDEGVAQLIKFNNHFAHVYIVRNGNQITTNGNQSKNNGAQSKRNRNQSKRNEIECIEMPMESPQGMEPSPRISLADSPFGHEVTNWKDLFLGTGQIFPDAVAFRQALYKYSIAHKFDYIFVKNSPQKMIVKCNMEGCKWKVTAYAVAKTAPVLRVLSFHNVHMHSAQENPIVNHKGICSLTSSIIMDGVKSSVDKTPNEIRSDLYRDYGVKLSYRQALRGKERALKDMHGRPEQSYMLIPWLCNRLMETDLNTVAKWVASTDNKFERLFIAYGCCINGFLLSARPVLYVDGFHLSGPYRGILLAASAYDADNELFPVAYAIVSGETLDEWTWFFNNVKEIIGSVQITIVSGRHDAIIDAVRAIFGDERHAYCYRHIKDNFSSEFTKVCKGMRRSSDGDALKLLDAIAYARLEFDFDKAMGKLWAFSPELAQWVHNNDVDRWALLRFPFKRWDNITTNIAESFKSWLMKGRGHNVCELINEHRDELAKKWYESKEAMRKWTNGVGPNVEAKLKENVLMAEITIAEQYGPHRILVHHGGTALSVNLTLRECTCKAWQMCGIPCAHACAAIKLVGDNVFNYVEECYLLSTQEKIYNSTMVPIETNHMPNVNALTAMDYMTHTFLQPPMITRGRGRPRSLPRSFHCESQSHQKVYHCSLCHEPGHSRRKCKNSITN